MSAFRNRREMNEAIDAIGPPDPATDPTTAAPATPGQLDLPPGIELDLVRWHCTRCETRGTWIRDAHIDPVAEATAEAFGHHANHVQWDAERKAGMGT